MEESQKQQIEKHRLLMNQWENEKRRFEHEHQVQSNALQVRRIYIC